MGDDEALDVLLDLAREGEREREREDRALRRRMARRFTPDERTQRYMDRPFRTARRLGGMKDWLYDRKIPADRYYGAMRHGWSALRARRRRHNKGPRGGGGSGGGGAQGLFSKPGLVSDTLNDALGYTLTGSALGHMADAVHPYAGIAARSAVGLGALHDAWPTIADRGSKVATWIADLFQNKTQSRAEDVEAAKILQRLKYAQDTNKQYARTHRPKAEPAQTARTTKQVQRNRQPAYTPIVSRWRPPPRIAYGPYQTKDHTRTWKDVFFPDYRTQQRTGYDGWYSRSLAYGMRPDAVQNYSRPHAPTSQRPFEWGGGHMTSHKL